MSLNMTNNRDINVPGLHASFGLNGLHCETTRAQSWTACLTMYGSRLATDADQRASFDSGHECCLCAYIDIGIRYFLQGTPGYCRNKPRGWVVCTQCASLFCVHDIGKKGDNTLPYEWCDNNCNDTISKHISLTYEPTPLDKMAAISQAIISGAFSWMKMFAFWLKFHWSLLLRNRLTITQHWFR